MSDFQEERVSPIRITDKEANVTYTLDFNRDSVRFAETRGFKMNDTSDFPMTKLPELWYYAFRMHHKNLSQTQTDAILEKLGGVTATIVGRLGELYMQAMASNNIIQTDEDLSKNSRMTVELD